MLKSLIGKIVIVKIKEDEEIYIDKECSVFTEDDFEYYSTDGFEVYDNEEILARIYEVTLIH